MNAHRRVSVSLAVLVAACTLAACGGDDDPAERPSGEASTFDMPSDVNEIPSDDLATITTALAESVDEVIAAADAYKSEHGEFPDRYSDLADRVDLPENHVVWAYWNDASEADIVRPCVLDLDSGVWRMVAPNPTAGGAGQMTINDPNHNACGLPSNERQAD